MGESKKKCDHLKKQDASTVDATKLTALTPDVVRLVSPCDSCSDSVVALCAAGFSWRQSIVIVIDSFCSVSVSGTTLQAMGGWLCYLFLWCSRQEW
jgi:hypothetical protein